MYQYIGYLYPKLHINTSNIGGVIKSERRQIALISGWFFQRSAVWGNTFAGPLIAGKIAIAIGSPTGISNHPDSASTYGTNCRPNVKFESAMRLHFHMVHRLRTNSISAFRWLNCYKNHVVLVVSFIPEMSNSQISGYAPLPDSFRGGLTV